MLALADVAARLDAFGIKWAVFAGAAARAYGATRPLTDLDILVPAAELAAVEAVFPEAQLRTFKDTASGLLLPGIDILAGLSLLDLDDEMAARLVRREIGGLTVPVIPPEDNILLKAMWGRGAEEGKHDWQDVEAMMTGLERLDWQYLRWRADGMFPRARVEGVLRCLEQLWEQTRNA